MSTENEDNSEQTAEEIAELYISQHHSNPENNRRISLWGEISPELSRAAIEGLVQLSCENPTAPVEMWISSPGGNVVDTLAIYDVMKYVSTPVHTIGVGKVQSSASLLVAAGEPGCRSMFENTSFMVHQMHYRYEGTLTDTEGMVKEVQLMQKNFTRLIVQNTNLTVTQFREILAKNTDKYITPEEAQQLGFIDFIRRPYVNTTH